MGQGLAAESCGVLVSCRVWRLTNTGTHGTAACRF